MILKWPEVDYKNGQQFQPNRVYRRDVVLLPYLKDLGTECLRAPLMKPRVVSISTQGEVTREDLESRASEANTFIFWELPEFDLNLKFARLRKNPFPIRKYDNFLVFIITYGNFKPDPPRSGHETPRIFSN